MTMAIVPNKGDMGGANGVADYHIPRANEWMQNRFVAVTPSDTVDLAVGHTITLTAAVAGVAKVNFQDGSQAIVPLAAGVPNYIDVKRVLATGTTATGIVAAY
jgi:hypothetical protein